MVAFRKLFPVLAIAGLLLGLTSGANAQVSGTQPLNCNTNAGVPPLLRAEGYTELTGDLVLVCSGGNPGQTFLANFQLFLNTNITSRLTTNGLSEALLMIDEPLIPRADFPSQPVDQVTPFLLAPPGTNANSNTAVTGNPASANPGALYQRNTYTVFQAQRASQGENAVVWAGIPITPPGTNGTRTIRITNVRAAAANLGTSATLIPTAVLSFLTVSASSTVAINNPQQPVGYIQTGLQFDVRNCINTDAPASSALNYAQCQSQNGALFTDPGSGGPFSTNLFGVRFREGFQTAFKPRILTPQTSSLPGSAYNAESGFVRPELGGDVVGAPGVANTATRVAARFAGVPAGLRIFVTSRQAAGTTPGTTAVAVTTDSSGAGGSGSAGTTSLQCSLGGPVTPGSEVVITNGTGVAVWEITGSESALIDEAFFQVAVAYNANTANNLPGLGQATVTGNFAPFYATNSGADRMSGGLPIPRFIDSPISRNIFSINSCVTNLLFPFVTNQAGYDTGIAISNTSRDPFSGNASRLQGGRCTINYYGNTTGGGAAPAAQTTNANVEAGSQLTFVVSSGGGLGIAGTPGFQGYIIATCNFRYAHAFAFILDQQVRVAEGYLALVMDSSIGTRTGNSSESLDN